MSDPAVATPAPRAPVSAGQRGRVDLHALAVLRRGGNDPGTALLAAQVVVAMAALVANVLAARMLAPSGRGELALLLQLAYLSSLGLLLGTDRSAVAVFTGSPARVVTRAFLRLLARPSLVMVAAGLAVVVLPLPGLDSWRVRLALAAGFALVNALVRAVRSIAVAAGRHREYLAYTVVAQGGLLGVLVALTLANRGDVATWLAAYALAGGLPTVAWLARWMRRDGVASLGEPSNLLQQESVRATRREGLQLLPATLANTGMLRLDRLLLAGMVSTAALGIYASVATMTEILAWPLISYADARLGVWRRAHDEGRLALRPVLLAVLGYCLVAGVVVGVALRATVVPLLGEDYAGARHLVLPLVLAAAMLGAAQVVVVALSARRRNRAASVAEVAGFAVSAVAYLLLVPGHGASGAAWGSLVGYAAVFVVAAAALSRVRRQS